MTTTELIEPVVPVAPEKNDEDLNELRMAIAAAITAVTKNKNIIVTESDIRTWNEPEGTVSFKVKRTHALYTEYAKQQRQYNQDKRDYDNKVAALKYGVTVDQYIDAKKRFDDYQSKKCEKSPNHEIEHFIDKVISLSIAHIEDNTPELTTS